MSDGGRDRESLGVKMRKSSQKWSAQRSDIRSIVRLSLLRRMVTRCENRIFEGSNLDATKSLNLDQL